MPLVDNNKLMVTLYVRVWIETQTDGTTSGEGNTVTLYVRVWIETRMNRLHVRTLQGHPLREGVD